jgi:hypothetical protein
MKLILEKSLDLKKVELPGIPDTLDTAKSNSKQFFPFFYNKDLIEQLFSQIARERAGSSPDPPIPRLTSLKSMSGSEDGLDRTLNPAGASSSSESQQQRAHSSVHVCWHRSTTVPVTFFIRNFVRNFCPKFCPNS